MTVAKLTLQFTQMIIMLNFKFRVPFLRTKAVSRENCGTVFVFLGYHGLQKLSHNSCYWA